MCPDVDPADLTTAGSGRPLLIVDAANVVGSVPDGWWRDRRGATERLRDRLAAVAITGLDAVSGPVSLLLVVEGRARGVAGTADVAVLDAPGSGDDAIVAAVAAEPGRRRIVVTADRELRRRVAALGAESIGPSALPRGTE
ncbi:hypothetical protein QSJ18_10825 [Gordonia sp. ABSL1-1]|uniref:hypothetical protein n=1 Tax=Gordonia sp. ABSL1-1 TaxID=3053923 RepID=UPI00257388B2|nr:hypothetical protein [Gordonia sp. ABSL1-1]MDL9937237.1 hypothetical protein [Gordonia sp. ABSL1-1]